jgi:MHS family proline/betaine transporter-like MFS transporter
MLIYGAWFAMVGVGSYLLQGYLASYLIRVVGLDSTGAFTAGLVAVLSLGAGAVTGGYLMDRYPARVVAATCAAGIALTVVPGFLVIQRGTVAAAIAGEVPLALCLGIGATFGATLSVALFPVRVRYTAVGFAHNVSLTLFGSTAPFVSAWLIGRTGSPVTPAWYVMAVALAAVAVAVIALRTPAERQAVAPGTPLSGEHGSRVTT